MCDCYSAKCQRCGREIPVHLADYAMPRRCVQVFCSDHIPRNDVVVFEVIEDSRHDWPIRKGSRFGFRFTEALPMGYEWDDFCPNVGSETTTTVRDNPIVEVKCKEVPREAS